MDELTLILCQPSPGVKTGAVPRIPQALRAVSAADLHKHTEALSTELFALTGNPLALTTEEMEQSRDLFQSDANLKMLLYFPRSECDAIACWQELPKCVAALRQNWAEEIRAMVLRTSFAKEQGFSDIPDLLWDLMIRTARTGEKIQVRQASVERESEASPHSSARPRLAPLVPGSSRHWLKSHLESVTPEDLVPKTTSRPDAIALKAGLFQVHDYLKESHELSQSIEGEGRNSSGDYWHAVMHRREPDYGNSKYWFRHVGKHPIFDPLAKAVEELLQRHDNPASQHARQKLLSKGQWDPFAFVDFCQECARSQDPESTRIAEEIQWREMCLLLEQTCRDAMA